MPPLWANALAPTYGAWASGFRFATAATNSATSLRRCSCSGGSTGQPSLSCSVAMRGIRSRLPQRSPYPLIVPWTCIHPHNDSGLAVANALAAVRAGCVHVQGTINGYGERCGNLDLIPLIATLQLKLGCPVLPPEQLRRLREVALFVAAVANLNPDAHAPYVGASAFAHKGGIHVAAVA